MTDLDETERDERERSRRIRADGEREVRGAAIAMPGIERLLVVVARIAVVMNFAACARMIAPGIVIMIVIFGPFGHVLVHRPRHVIVGQGVEGQMQRGHRDHPEDERNVYEKRGPTSPEHRHQLLTIPKA